MKKSKDSTTIPKSLIDLYFKEPYYAVAIGSHVNHKRERLDIAGEGFLETIYKDKSRFLVFMKGTQCGISEYLMIRSFVRARDGKSVLYVFPTFEVKNLFVKERVEKSIAFTPYYQSLNKKTKLRYDFGGLGLKMFGSGVISYSGSNTTNSFVSFQADDIIVDEMDLCDQMNLDMCIERQANSKDPTTVKVGNPTVSGFGISGEFETSSKTKWFIKCSHCGEYVNPDFFRNLIQVVDNGIYVLRDRAWKREMKRDINMICDHCGKPLDRYGKGQWVDSYQGRDKKGYHISKLFSTRSKLMSVVKRYEEGLGSTNIMQRFYNADLGMPYTQSGAKLSREDLDKCVGDYQMPEGSQEPCVMGVDVGNVLHVCIMQPLPDGKMKALFIGEAHELVDLVYLIKSYNVICTVIDSMPEIRLAKELCARYQGAFRCFFGGERKDTINAADKTIVVNRTQTLDLIKESIVMQHIIFPRTAATIKDFYDHMQSNTRVFDEKRQKYDWVNGNQADHLFFAMGYCLTARKLLSVISGR